MLAKKIAPPIKPDVAGEHDTGNFECVRRAHEPSAARAIARRDGWRAAVGGRGLYALIIVALVAAGNTRTR